jgi:hypothetical protein
VTASDSDRANSDIRLSAVARTALVCAAGEALSTVMYLGLRQKSDLLVAMFVIWVLAPFGGLVLADRRSKRWPDRGRVIIHAATIFLSLASFAAYADVFLRPIAKPASRFLLVPLASWVVIGIVVLAARRWARTEARS